MTEMQALEQLLKRRPILKKRLSILFKRIRKLAKQVLETGEPALEGGIEIYDLDDKITIALSPGSLARSYKIAESAARNLIAAFIRYCKLKIPNAVTRYTYGTQIVFIPKNELDRLSWNTEEGE